jgi:chromosome segregation ATPase
MRLNPIDASMLPSHSIRARLSAMLVEVQTTENPKTIGNFLEQIRGMMTKLQAEQTKHQEISDKMMAQCQEEDKFRAKEVEDSKDALVRARAAKAKCQASLDSAEKDLPDLEAALANYQKELAQATAQREAEHKSYLERKQDFEQAIAFLTDFIKYVKTNMSNFKSLSFVDKSQQLLRHASKLGLLTQVVPVLAALATRASDDIPEHNHYAYNNNEDIANTLNNALNTLLKRIQADWKTNEDIEIAAVNAFTILKERLVKAINSLENNIKRTKQQIVEMTTCIKNEASIISTANAKLSRNSELRESASKMCGEFAKEFVDATKSRLEEIETINEILAIIEKRFEKIPADLKAYLISVENGWREYQNSTNFKKFEQYVQKHVDDNSHGKVLATTKHVE